MPLRRTGGREGSSRVGAGRHIAFSASDLVADRSRTLARPGKIPALLLAGAGAVTTIVLVGFGPYSRFSLAISVAVLVIGRADLLLKQPWMENIWLAAWCVAMMVYLGDGGMELFRHFSERREMNLKIQYASSPNLFGARGTRSRHREEVRGGAFSLRDYFYPYHGHFTEKGYRRAGELVLDELQKQRLLLQ